MEQQPTDTAHSLLGPGAGLRRWLGLSVRRGRPWSVTVACLTLLCAACGGASATLKLVMDPPQELEEIANLLFVIFIHYTAFIKDVLFIYQSDTMHQLVQLLLDARRQYSNGKSNESIRNWYQVLSNRIYLCMQALVVPALTAWTCSPALASVLSGSGEASPGSSRQFPVPVWLPVETRATPTYQLIYAVQACCLVVTAQAALSVDVFFFHMLLMLTGELAVLNENVSATRKRRDSFVEPSCKGYSDTTKGELVLRNSDMLTEDDNQMWIQLVKNVQHHQVILRLAALLERAMSVSIFILLLVNTANLCSCMFVAAVLLQRDGNVTKALRPVCLIPAVIYESGMFCIFGHFVTDQSEILMSSLFSCDWTSCNYRFRRGLLLSLRAALRPVVVRVGKTSKLSKEMLVQILNGSYAMLNLLYSCSTLK